MSVGIECQKKAKQLWQFRISKIRNNRDRNRFGRDHAGMVLPAWNDFWSSLACPRAPPFTPNNRFRLASKFTFPLIFCHQQGYNPTCVPLRELYGQLAQIVARAGGGQFQYTNSANPTLSARRRLTCPPNECGRDKNLTDGQNIFDVFSFSKYFASFLPLITIPSQNYLSFVPQAACQRHISFVSTRNTCNFTMRYVKGHRKQI